MKSPEADGGRAKVLAAALRTWTTVDNDPQPPVARLEIRYPPNWAFASTNPITARQQGRLLAFLRDDLAENRPTHSTPERAAAVIHGLIAEHAAVGHTRITTADLTEAAPRIGRSRTWIAGHITNLVDSGVLHETRRPDTFRIN
ncbi:hypothetical protein GTY67_13515 [Streptomyces sp. SID8374]|uniref:hypothetical protein n=1 Tax=Streptomyces sp. SID8374 TaxID=2690354 RepID=UPI0013689B55|nr:hypothetical protein [Streptomyces sp. SID8374]MYX14415.1 hypothetical protein [Streptomyces sp. SID8374]